MNPVIINLIAVILFIGTSVFFSYIDGRARRKEREAYIKVFEETIQLLADRNTRSVQRVQMLHAMDWRYARRTHGNLLGLSFILPGEVMESANPIDVTKYFTDDEAEAIIEGLEIFEKDQRTKHLCKNFVVKV